MTTPPGSGDSTPSAAGDSSLPEGFVPPTFSSDPARPLWQRILRWTAASLAVVVLLATAFVVGDYFYIKSKIHTEKIHRSEPAPPKLVAKAENFVLIGSDTRAGANGAGTGSAAKISGARSDTTMILHISAGASGATLVSIPRDSYVQIPACVVGPNGQKSAPEMNKFNAAYSIGGEYNNKYAPSCTIETIESLTGLHIDHYAVVDFIGFEHMVEKLGGVKMCVAHRLYDPIVNEGNGAFHGSGLNLPAGRHVEINGTQALALMRARYNLDGGGDLPRIKRQQEFAAAMIRKATSGSLLYDPLKLQGFLTTAASSLTTDGFGLGTMHKLASALHDVGAGGVRLLTVPNLTDQPGLPYGDVEWDPTKAPALWAALRHDEPIPGVASPSPSASPSATASPAPTGPPLTISPGSIYVNVLNGTGTQGLAHTVADQLTAQGYHVVSISDADKDTYSQTLVKYGPTRNESSETVAAALPGSKRVADPTAGSVVTVIVGSDFTKVLPVTVGGATTPTPTATPTISSISAAKPGCLS